jgi:hypothetical protein
MKGVQSVNKIDLTHEERRLNVECGQAIEQAISETFVPGAMAGTGYYDNEIAVKKVIYVYGADRVAGVLAANINSHDFDGRLTMANKEWAKAITTNDKPGHYISTHLTIINTFANKLREFIQKEEENNGFEAPEKSETSKDVEDYLTGEIGLDKGIVKSCIERGSVYQTEVYSEKHCKDVPCVVFAGFDETGKIQSAVIKGFGTYEKVAPGSQHNCAFILPAKESKSKPVTAVSVFENPLEVLAGATFAKMANKTGYDAVHRLSVVKTWLYSTHAKALKVFLDNNPNVRTVNLCLTNTPDGGVIANRINTMLKELSERRGVAYKVNNLIPTEKGGYLDKLKNMNNETKSKQNAMENRE